jgi:hypothetical protein
MSVTAHEPRSGSRVLAAATLLLAIAWSQNSLAVPVLYVSVNGAPEVSLENDQVCDGTKAVTCLGTGAVGDLLISSFELTADPDPYVTGAFNFYNGSASTMSVVATVLFPMAGSFGSPQIAIGTGLVNNVFGGGILNLQVAGYVDTLASPVLGINEIAPGVPFSVCDDLGADPGCQNSVFSLGATQPGPGTLNVLSQIGLRLSFQLSPDTVATIGLDPGEPFAGAAYLSIVPVPVPAAAWLLGGALALLGATRRRTGPAHPAQG